MPKRAHHRIILMIQAGKELIPVETVTVIAAAVVSINNSAINPRHPRPFKWRFAPSLKS